MANGVSHQGVTDEVVAVLAKDLTLAWYNLEAAAHPYPEGDDNKKCNDRLPERLVHPRHTEGPTELEVLKPWSVKLQRRHDPAH